ncbi:MAG: LOG family protein [Infirmifilum sp.]
MRVIGIACLGTEPPDYLVEKAVSFVRELKNLCKEEVFLALGGYWGLMKRVVDEAIAAGFRVVLFPPLERESEIFPDQALVVKTGMGYRLRSVIFVRTVDVLVALGGEAGTIQEVITAYLEGKPVLVLGETGFASDKLKIFAPYVDSRKTVGVKIVSEPKKLAVEACGLANR